MKLKHELEIDPLDPFGKCKLDRKKYAPALTNMLETFPDGFVMAIDNEWGTGKTTFVKMWQASIKEDYQTIYFNAWENDFDNDVLAALIGELGTLNRSSGTETIFKEVVKKGAVLSKNILPILIEAAAKKYIGEGVINKVVTELAKSSGDIMIEQVTEYANKKKGLIEFRDSLVTYIEATKGGKPIVFIIDELDRCRPDYAVEVLEKVKHFFSVKGIVFVLSINKKELKNAIRGVYNSANINADDYLRRFIDIEYSIPEPNKELFCKYLYSYYDFDGLANEINNNGTNTSYSVILALSINLFSINNTTLRQQEKLFAHACIVFHNLEKDIDKKLIEVAFLLVYFKCMFPDFYRALKQKQKNVQEIFDELQVKLPLPISSFTDTSNNMIYRDITNNMIYIESLLIESYNSYYLDPDTARLFDENGLLKINISPKDMREKFTRRLENIQFNDAAYSLHEIFKTIDLINIK